MARFCFPVAVQVSDTDLCRMKHNLTVGAHAYVSDGCGGVLQQYLQVGTPVCVRVYVCAGARVSGSLFDCRFLLVLNK